MPTIDSPFIQRTVSELVQINSINPTLAPGAPGEAEVADYTAAALGALGLEVRQHEPVPGRVSTVGRLRGTGGGRSLMLNAHYDTVGVEGMPDPFSGAVRNGRVYGRGAYDMKGSLAACIGAVKALIDSGTSLAGDLLVAGVADEEHSSLGTQDLIQHYSVDGAIVTEPTALEICLAHKGFIWMEVETRGRAAHGSKPELGVDANLRMGRVLAGLATLEHELRNRPPHPLVGRPSVHAATLIGGTGLSTYAALCRLQIERRTVPGERESDVRDEFTKMIDHLRKKDPTIDVSLTHLLTRDAFEVDRGTPVVRAVRDGLEAVRPGRVRYMGETPWMDSAFLAAAGIDTVVIGPDGGGAHAAEEWVELETVTALADILANAAIAYCRPN